VLRTAVVSLLLVLAPWHALAEKRVALVIGNSVYQYTARLGNPNNDATDVTAALQSHGFRVIEGRDLDKAAMDRKIRDFASMLSGSDVGIFFYAGHGLQVGGQNYLVPVDAQLTTASALDFEMVRLDLVHRTMEREAKTNLLFLDACRDNPLARNLARAMGTRTAEIGRGLAAVESGVGTLISFSTQPGNVALDGVGRNSPFAGALVKHILGSNTDLSALLIAVRNDVMTETDRKQVPWEHSALTGRFFFKEKQDLTSTAPAVPTGMTEAAHAWSVAERSNSVAVLEAFISHYGHTFYGAIARSRLAELNNRQSPVSTLPKEVSSPAVQTQDRVAVAPPSAIMPPTAKQRESVAPSETLPQVIHMTEYNTTWGTFSITLRRVSGNVYEGTWNHGVSSRMTVTAFTRDAVTIDRKDTAGLGQVSGRYIGQRSGNRVRKGNASLTGTTSTWDAHW
jgi:uncharacterized caspase-like protein